MNSPSLAAQIAAMEMLESALELPGEERFDFIAGSAKPISIRQLALRLLPLTNQRDIWASVADQSVHPAESDCPPGNARPLG